MARIFKNCYPELAKVRAIKGENRKLDRGVIIMTRAESDFVIEISEDDSPANSAHPNVLDPLNREKRIGIFS